MERISTLVLNLGRDERGATSIEYGLIVTFISLAIVGAATQIGQSVSNVFEALARGFTP